MVQCVRLEIVVGFMRVCDDLDAPLAAVVEMLLWPAPHSEDNERDTDERVHKMTG